MMHSRSPNIIISNSNNDNNNTNSPDGIMGRWMIDPYLREARSTLPEATRHQTTTKTPEGLHSIQGEAVKSPRMI